MTVRQLIEELERLEKAHGAHTEATVDLTESASPNKYKVDGARFAYPVIKIEARR